MNQERRRMFSFFSLSSVGIRQGDAVIASELTLAQNQLADVTSIELANPLDTRFFFQQRHELSPSDSSPLRQALTAATRPSTRGRACLAATIDKYPLIPAQTSRIDYSIASSPPWAHQCLAQPSSPSSRHERLNTAPL